MTNRDRTTLHVGMQAFRPAVALLETSTQSLKARPHEIRDTSRDLKHGQRAKRITSPLLFQPLLLRMANATPKFSMRWISLTPDLSEPVPLEK